MVAEERRGVEGTVRNNRRADRRYRVACAAGQSDVIRAPPSLPLELTLKLAGPGPLGYLAEKLMAFAFSGMTIVISAASDNGCAQARARDVVAPKVGLGLKLIAPGMVDRMALAALARDEKS